MIHHPNKLEREQLRAQYRFFGDPPKHQQLALGARLIQNMVRDSRPKDIKPFAIACIRMQTFFRGGIAT